MTNLIAIDLDGTLLNSKNEISPENIQAIKEAQNAGIEIVIATGRAHFDVQAIFKDTDIKTWIIAANGATIFDPEGNLYHHQPIDPTTAYKVLHSLEQDGFYYEVFSSSCIYTPNNGRKLLQIEIDRIKSANPDVSIHHLEEALSKQFSQTGFTFIDSYKNIIEEADTPVYNILAFSFFEEKLKEGWSKYGQIEGLTIVSSANHNFELEHQNASKGIALELLSEKLGIALEHTAAIGDSMNDLSMLSRAGVGIAMGNAKNSIKEVADLVTVTNDENGVAHFIQSVLNNV
ncbi:Cof-type HAD-IIB family hydrolase [Metabacillus litoralis]|uniref:Cof-type HAD-IIB family hydrolase n=1 Tax=Metabacillus litoralis TaxID=152268 RepID=UPI00203CE224|nr:Cof-type HAD-IIB family hydrolase [Metabacillus litoralis]MCM3163585.1 Cof-type HAD-IIB family hydrolase [Metabacillus litoralis]